MYRYFCSALLLVLALTSWSQAQQQADSIPKIPIDWKPHDLKIGTNLIRAGRTAFGSGLTTYEVQGALAMYRAIVVLELGVEENRRGELFEYVNTGQYARIGADWNFIKDQPSGNVLSLGLRYARAGFEDQLAYTQDLGFGEQNYRFENDKLNARWFELNLNLRGKIVSNLYMGFTMRWQFARKINGEGTFKTFDVPGFGKTSRENSTAFDYFVAWRIPLKG